MFSLGYMIGYLMHILRRLSIRTKGGSSMNRYGLFLLLFILAGCKAGYEDVSNEAKYSNLINAEYRTLEALSINGVNLGDNQRKEIDVYTVTKKPGLGGRYVIKNFDLKSGSEIRIKKILRCKNCFPSKIIFSIDILSESLTPNRPIQLVNLSVKNSEGELVMDSVIFSKK